MIEKKDTTLIINAIKGNIQNAKSFDTKEALRILEAKYIKYENEIR